MNSENFTGKYLFGSLFWISYCLIAIQKSFFGRVPSIKYFWVSFQNKFQLNKEEHIRFVALSLRPTRLNIQNIFRSKICIDYIKLITAKKWSFPRRIASVNVLFPVDLVTLTGKIVNRKVDFLCNVCYCYSDSDYYQCLMIFFN